ncbi:MAG: glycosyltransferase family 4 protein, partial [Ktedonobacterales bacterium]|nr:glycosyltransferase family 4 protein [Ktedonobacterales bacterium]
PSAALMALRDVPDIHLRATHFGPTVFGLSRRQQAANVFRGLTGMTDLVGLAWYIRRHRIQIIHGTEKPRDAFYGALLAMATGAHTVTHLHVKCEDWLSPLTQWALRRGDGIIGVSRFVAGSAVAMGYPANRVHYVLNGLDASRWDADTDGGPIRREFGIAPEAPLLGVISRLFHWKGHTELLRALAIVREEVPGVRLLIVGEDDVRGAPERGSYTAELKALTSELGLDDTVIFTGFRADVASILAACDIYTMPTFEEPCAVVFLEAMAMKKPVVALESGGTPELIEQGKAGLLSAPGDIPQLAANIVRLIRDADLRQRLSEYGRRRVEEDFTPQRMADECEAIYRHIVGT